MTHPILPEHPRIIEIAERTATVEAARDRFRENANAERVTYEERLEVWKRERERARIEGDPIPDPPTPPESDTDTARYYVEQLARLRQDRRDVFASISSEVEAAASERETELLAEAGPIIDQLAEIADEISGLLDAVGQVATAEAVQDGIAPESRRRFRHSVSAADLVRIVTAGERPLDPVQERKARRLSGSRRGEL